MRTIDVGVGHYYYLVVTQLVDVGFLVVLAVHAEAYADALYDVHHRLALEHLVPHYLLNVQYLSPQRQYGLGEAVASLLGRTACGVSLDEEYLALLRVLVRAVGQLAGKSAAAHRVFPLYALARLSRRNTRRGGQDNLVAYLLCLLRMLLKIIRQGFRNGLLHGSCNLAVAQLGLCLSLELRLGHLY